MDWNSLCSPGWLRSHGNTPDSGFPSTGIRGLSPHAWLSGLLWLNGPSGDFNSPGQVEGEITLSSIPTAFKDEQRCSDLFCFVLPFPLITGSQHGALGACSVKLQLLEASTVLANGCLGFASIAVIETMMKSNLGRKGFVWLTYSASQSTDRSQGGNLRQELKQKSWRNTADWLVPRVLLKFSYTTQVHLPRGVRPTVG